ncbi:response regulator [Geotalea toluenoxydans]|uniref:response regulator n=1 Tax=Geotalea toluenoxydans TaxID=421624 RepID=UPI0006D19D82|nr:response regulator [Geotalea toluenoxydans]
MNEREILIADRDNEFRNQIAEYFRQAGYQVETTDSAIHAFCSIVEKHIPVILLGDDFDGKLASADLIPLLKKCNRQLAIIVVSDEMPLSVARKIRQEGIFYHAFKPAAPADREELHQAVSCALKKNFAKNRID